MFHILEPEDIYTWKSNSYQIVIQVRYLASLEQ